jgi:hypothetical protein
MAAAGQAIAAGREPNRIRRGQIAAQPHRAVRADGVGVGLGHGTTSSQTAAIIMLTAIVAGAAMALSDQPVPTPRIRLLAALPPGVLTQLWSRLDAVELPLRKVLHEPGKPITAVYFPETSYVSMLAHMQDGDAAEVGLAGYEGMAGLPVLLGADHDDIEAMVQSPGIALRMDTGAPGSGDAELAENG